MTSDAVGGVWTYALDLAGGLAGAGVETLLVTLGPRPSHEQRRAARATPGVTLIETDLALDWTAAHPGEIEAAAGEIGRLARATGADLAHLNSPALAFGGGFEIPVVGVTHSCLLTWWSAARTDEPPEDIRWRIEAHRRGLQACDRVMAPTAGHAAATARAYAMAPPHVVHNGREPPDTTLRQDFEPLVFTAGRLWDEGKNMAVMDAAACRSRFPIYAAGPLAGPAQHQRVVLRHMRHLGNLDPAAMREWLTRAPVYASSALYEPFGLGVLEAAQAGCALVLSAIPTFRELWTGAAVFVDPTNPAAFAQAFDALFRNDELRTRLGALARARASRFSVPAMTAGVLDAYAAVGLRGLPRTRAEAAA